MKTQISIAVIGYGKMGKEVEKHALEQNQKIAAIIDNEDDWQNMHKELKGADVAIEFSMPGVAKENILKCFNLDLPVVTGTTGWYDDLPEISEVCNRNKQSLLYSPNFSIGVNVFFELSTCLAKVMNNFDQYRPKIEETHHKQKLDAPSGTAAKIAEDMIKQLERLNNRIDYIGDTAQVNPGELPVQSHRENGVTGTHIVSYDSSIDTIEIKHTAHNRSGFVLGAIDAAKWLIGKKGVFTMKDYLNI